MGDFEAAPSGLPYGDDFTGEVTNVGLATRPATWTMNPADAQGGWNYTHNGLEPLAMKVQGTFERLDFDIPSGSSTMWNHYYYDVGLSDLSFEFPTSDAFLLQHGGILFRYVDAENFSYIALRSTSACDVITCNDNVKQDQGNLAVPNLPSGGFDVKYEMSGSTVSLYIDDVFHNSVTITTSYPGHSTATRHGWTMSTNTSSRRVDWFRMGDF